MLGPCIAIAPTASRRFERWPSAVISVSTTTKRKLSRGAAEEGGMDCGMDCGIRSESRLRLQLHPDGAVEFFFHSRLAARRGLERFLQQGALQARERLGRNKTIQRPAFPRLTKL